MFVTLSIASAATVLAALIFLAFRQPGLLLKPSTLFVGFFFLQVQLSAAINASAYEATLASPWPFFLLVQAFPLACLGIVFLFQRRRAEALYASIGASVPSLALRPMGMVALLLLLVNAAIVAIYLGHIPYNKTGLYAALFEPEMHDSYRELSMKLIPGTVLPYLFTILEKVLAPISSAACALFAGQAWRVRRYGLVLVGILGVLLSVLPAMLYGARGPGAMVVLAALFALFLAFGRRLSVGKLTLALMLVLLPPVSIMLVKNQNYSPQAIAFQAMNALDRVIGRGYIDNVWHIQRVEKNGPYGIAAIEKLASAFGAKPVDAFHEVALANKDQGLSFGLKALEVEAPVVVAQAPKNAGGAGGAGTAVAAKPGKPDAAADVSPAPEPPRSIGDSIQCDPAKNPDCVDVTKSASAGASFVVMNYAAFGYWGLLLSLGFVFAIDMLLWLYERISSLTLVPAIAASVVPALALSFSFFTTVLASKGMLLIPLTCLGLGWLLTRSGFAGSARC